MTFPAYSSYRYTRTEWLNHVPEHWEICPIRRYCDDITDGAHVSPESEGGVYCFVSTKDVSETSIDFDNCLKTSPSSYDALVRSGCRPFVGDVLFSKDGTIGRTFVINEDHEFVVASSLIIIRPTRTALYPQYLHRLCQSTLVASQVESFVRGAGLPRLSISNLRKVVGCFPTYEEQIVIAAFLDRETSKIDALVAEQQRLIELLKEKRQAVISHAVTKGLNPDVPMKPSGIEWLGDVPKHWDLMPLKRNLLFITSGSRGWAANYADAGALFLRIGNLTRDGIGLDLSDIQRVDVPEGIEAERTKVKAGDILFSVTAYLGSIAVVPEQLEAAYVSQHIALTRLSGQSVSPQWVGYMAISSVGKTWFDLQAYGGTKIQLSLDDVRETPIFVPPRHEQESIVRFIERQLADVDALIAEAQCAVELLQERRTALISAAVTGKIDVRGLVNSEAA